uniref:Uncharacterized protein n=1 Tax=Arundo donax TaxID=35708 RepID=A0A0A9E315_ARUDO
MNNNFKTLQYDILQVLYCKFPTFYNMTICKFCTVGCLFRLYSQHAVFFFSGNPCRKCHI